MEKESLLIKEPANDRLKNTASLAGLGKRTFAGILDLFIMVFIAIFLYAVVAQPVFISWFKTNEIAEKTTQMQVDSKLYQKDDEGLIIVLEEKNYMSGTKAYFEEYCSVSDETKACSITGMSFADAILAEEVFQKYYAKDANGDLIYNEQYLDEKANVELNVYGYGDKQFKNSQAYKKINNEAMMYFMVEVYCCLIISSIIFYLIVPMLLKNGKTFGKLIMKISLANAHGYKIRKSQIIIRCAAFFLINIVLGLETYFIVPFISFTVMIFTKKATSVHDYCSATIVVDDVNSIIFSNREEHLKSIENEEKTHERILEKRRQIANNVKTKE